MRAIVTGAGGFIGRHLCAALAQAGIKVIAIGREASAARDYVAVFEPLAGMPDRTTLAAILERHEPALVYHLAGASAAPTFEELVRINVLYGEALMSACRSLSVPPRLIVAGSAAEYGAPLQVGRLMREDDLAAPRAPYGITKLTQTNLALACPELLPVVARIFNPIGVAMPETTAAGRFVARMRDMAGRGGVIDTGPLTGIRDFVEVREVARALVAMGQPRLGSGIYNICTGIGHRMSEITDILSSLVEFPVSFSPKGDDAGVDWAVGDPGKLAAHGITIASTDLARVFKDMLAAAGLRPRHAG
jgi:nucleoside-diphosphate-sugar epimerase